MAENLTQRGWVSDKEREHSSSAPPQHGEMKRNHFLTAHKSQGAALLKVICHINMQNNV